MSTLAMLGLRLPMDKALLASHSVFPCKGHLLGDPDTFFSTEAYRFVDAGKAIYHDRVVDLSADIFEDQRDLTVYCERLTIRKDFQYAGKNIYLYCNELVIASPTGSATIDLSGANGAALPIPTAADGPPGHVGNKGVDGSNGQDGGRCTIVYGSVTGNLKIISNGGAGSNAQNGGNGGVGLQGHEGANGDANCNGDKLGKQGGPGQSGGFGGAGGVGGKGGNSGRIILLGIQHQQGNFTLDAKAGPSGVNGQSGHGGAGGPGGVGGLNQDCKNVRDNSVGHDHAGGKSPDVDDSSTDPETDFDCVCKLTGTRSNRVGPTGPNGLDGIRQGSSPLLGTTTLVVHSPITVAEHSAYGSLLLARILLFKAELDYYSANVQKKDDASLLRAKATLLFLTNLCSTEYAGRRIPRPGELGYPYASAQPNVYSDWQVIGAKSAIMLRQIDNGLDYYGNPFNYAPRTTMTQWQNLLTTVYFPTISTIDAGFNRFMNEWKEGKVTIQTLEANIDAFVNQDAVLQKQIDDKVKEFNSLQNDIASLNKHIQELMTDLLNVSPQFQKNVESYIRDNSGGCNFANSLGIMGSIITISGDIGSLTDKSVARDYAKIGTSALNTAGTIDTMNGKDQMAERSADTFTMISANSLEGFLKAFANAGGNTNIDPNDPNNFYALSYSDYISYISQFKNIDGYYQYKFTLDQYMSNVDTRNKKIVTRDQDYAAVMQALAEKQKNEAAIAQMRSKVNDATQAMEHATEVRILMEELNWQMKKSALRALYMEQKTYGFWSITNDDHSTGLYKNDLSLASLQKLHSDIASNVVSVLEQRGTGSTAFKTNGYKDIRFAWSAHPKTPQEHVANKLIEDFRKKGKFSMTFEINDPNTFFARLNACEIFVSSVMLKIDNFTSDSGYISVRLTHSGRSSLKNFRKPGTIEFLQARQEWPLLISKDGTTKPVILTGDQPLDNRNFALFSPFTTWTVDIQPNNPGLNVSDVSSIAFRFSGYNRTCQY